MPSVDKILAHSFRNDWANIEEQFDALEDADLGEREEKVFIDCTSRKDDDYEIAAAIGCSERVDISESPDAKSVICECGREIDLTQKHRQRTFEFNTDFEALRNWVQSRVKTATNNSSVQMKDELTFLSHTFDRSILVADLNLLRDNEHVTDVVDIHLCTERLPRSVAETIKLYGRQACFILVGEGVNNHDQFDDLNLPYAHFADLFDADDSAFENQIWDLLDAARAVDSLTDIEQRAEIAENLYTNHRHKHDGVTAIDEDDFEYIVNTLLNYCFMTSRMFGTTMAGKEVPDGVLCMQRPNGGADVYMWDAKYSSPENEPHELTANNQRNMTKYPKIIHDKSGMDERDADLTHFAGFIYVTPRLKTSNLVGFAKKLNERYADGSIIKSTVAHLRIDALLAFYRAVRENKYDARRVEVQTHKHFNSLLTDDDYHSHETEFIEHQIRNHGDDPEDWPPIGPSGIGIFDITTGDIEYIFDEYIKGKSSPQTEIDYQSLRNSLSKIRK